MTMMIEGFIKRGSTENVECWDSEDKEIVVIKHSDGRTKILKHEPWAYNQVKFDGYLKNDKQLKFILSLINKKT